MCWRDDGSSRNDSGSLEDGAQTGAAGDGFVAPPGAAPREPWWNKRRYARPTDRTLREQMHITDLEIERRKTLLRFTADDADLLAEMLPLAKLEVDDIVARFYAEQTAIPQISVLIGDADTLRRLHRTMRDYILDLFSGVYDAAYVNKRLRIGMAHKRIGVGPKLYLAGVCCLKTLLNDMIERHTPRDRFPSDLRQRRLSALYKLMYFDNALVFDTYFRSLMAELETSHRQMEEHAAVLEETVALRTRQLEALSRTDSLTGLLNRRVFDEALEREIKIADRTGTAVSLVFIDLDGFKTVNDDGGHAEGDRILALVGATLLKCVRAGEAAFRLGGDEFAIIMPRTNADEAEVACRRIGDDMHKACHRRVKASMGIAQTGPGNLVTAEQLFRHADAAMYEAKRSEGSPVRIVRAVTGAADPGRADKGAAA
jgi:diguanylate cyclase (GGDEF)-like protein